MTETDQNTHPCGESAPEAPTHSVPAAPPARNAGLSLVAAFRAARIQQRPALQTGLRASRYGLRQERLARLGKAAVASPTKTTEAPLSHAGASPPREEMAPDPGAGQSVFARFMDGAQAEAPAVAAAQPPPATTPHLLAEPLPAEPQLAAPPLSAIGFGPGMVIRFRQLGIETAADLAAADADALRTALGDITRLINVDIWIASAQKACSAAA